MKATSSLALVLLAMTLFSSPLTSNANTIWDHDPYAITDLGTVSVTRLKSQTRHVFKYRRNPRTRIRVPRLQEFVGIEDGQHTYLDTIQVKTYNDSVGSNGQLDLAFYYDAKVNGSPQLTKYANAGTYIAYHNISSSPPTFTIDFKNGIIGDLKNVPNILHPRKLFVVATRLNDPKQSHCVAEFTLIKDDTSELP